MLLRARVSQLRHSQRNRPFDRRQHHPVAKSCSIGRSGDCSRVCLLYWGFQQRELSVLLSGSGKEHQQGRQQVRES